MAERVPPGRAGRLWLLSRLDTARRGADLLRRKRQLLRREHQRLSLLVEETARAWRATSDAAERWGLRAALLGGTTSVRYAAGRVQGQGNVLVAWRNTMGVRHPDEVRCVLPELSPAEVAAANSALGPAATAHRRALEAAARHAVAVTAQREVEAELVATQRRLRAIERHRIPVLEAELRTLLLRLDEFEREERVITLWASVRLGNVG